MDIEKDQERELFAKMLGITPQILDAPETKEKAQIFDRNKIQKDREALIRMTRAELIQESEKYRRQINHSQDLSEMLDTALRCIGELTGERLFYQSNQRKVKALQQGGKDGWKIQSSLKDPKEYQTYAQEEMKVC